MVDDARGKEIEGRRRMVTRLKGKELVVSELLRVDERCEEETKKCALGTVRGGDCETREL